MRTEGGFRLYSESYVFLCQLIRDLQLFGYTLEEIKDVSGEVRDFLSIEGDLAAFPRANVGARLEGMLGRIQALRDRMKQLGEGIDRWQDLLKKKRKGHPLPQGEEPEKDGYASSKCRRSRCLRSFS